MITLHPQPTFSDPQLVHVSIVVPCFNEEDGIDQLTERLKTLRAVFADRLSVEVVFVDDGSTDDTASILKNRFQQNDWVRIVRHGNNRGIAAAIMTGIQAASNELVASIDADCTYDPIQIVDLVDLMVTDVAMVTASPYHPKGAVEGVPRWRLALSQIASRGYGLLLGSSLHTYTSCFRVYRKSCMTSLSIRDSGFVGVTEMLWQVQRNGGKIVEAPARLTSRRIGYSKMKTVPVIVSHIKLMGRILCERVLKR